MPIVGFNFTDINVTRKESVAGKIGINNNVAIKNVEEAELAIDKTKQGALKFTFEFISKYDPGLGEIKLQGNLLFIEDAKKVKEINEEWKKDKKVAKDVMAGILNTALNKCNILALILSQEVNLPPPIPLPKVKMPEEGKKEAKK